SPVDGVTVHERHAPPRRMPGIGPVTHLEQDRLEQPHLDDFAAHALDLHPIPHAHAVASHQQEHPRNANRKSFKATVSPAVARPMMVGVWFGGPNTISRITRPPARRTASTPRKRSWCIRRRSFCSRKA